MNKDAINQAGNDAKNGTLPEGVEMIYFTEGKRQIVIAVRKLPDEGAFEAGWAIFRKENSSECFKKKDLRETAIKRLLKIPVVVTGPHIPVIRDGDTEQKFTVHKAKCAEDFVSVFSKSGVETFNALPFPVYQHKKETTKQFAVRKEHATTSFLRDNPNAKASEVDELRVKKAGMMALRRSFYRQVPTIGYKKKSVMNEKWLRTLSDA
jgi:hypothetical protein